MKKQFVGLILLSMVATVNAETVQTNMKIGFISAGSLLNESKLGKQLKNEIDQKYESIARELQMDEQKLVKSSNELQAKKTTLAADAFDAEENKLKKGAISFQAKRQEREEEFKSFSQKKQLDAVNYVVETAATIGQQENYDAIIDKDSGRVVWAAAKNDCTSKLLACLDKKFDQTTKVASNPTKKSA